MMMIKLKADNGRRDEIARLVDIFGARWWTLPITPLSWN